MFCEQKIAHSNAYLQVSPLAMQEGHASSAEVFFVRIVFVLNCTSSRSSWCLTVPSLFHYRNKNAATILIRVNPVWSCPSSTLWMGYYI